MPAGSSGKNNQQTIITSTFSDNNRSILILSVFLLLLLALAVGVAALVKIILLENKKDDRFDEVLEKLGNLREEFDFFETNTTDRFAENQEIDEKIFDNTLSLFRGFGIIEHITGNSPLSWSGAKSLCNNEGHLLCSVDDLFPEPEEFYKPSNIPGEDWVPIRDEYNDWVQIGQGNKATFGKTFKAFHGEAPAWGESSSTSSLKKRVFCCIKFGG